MSVDRFVRSQVGSEPIRVVAKYGEVYNMGTWYLGNARWIPP